MRPLMPLHVFHSPERENLRKLKEDMRQDVLGLISPEPFVTISTWKGLRLWFLDVTISIQVVGGA